MARTAVLGLPRVGPNRELKFALEAFWAGRIGRAELDDVARTLRRGGFKRARGSGIDVIPSGDFSLYDHVLDTACALGVLDRDAYFGHARGTATRRPLEMTKWFDTNYHYLVPELVRDQRFELDATHWTEPLREAAALGIRTRPVVVGPLTFLELAKGEKPPLPALVDVYVQLLTELAAAGASEVQLDEPCLALDRSAYELDAYADAFAALAQAPVEICLATYFAPADPRVLALPAAEVHIDLVRAPGQLSAALERVPGRLSLGVVDGRNVWTTDLDRALERIDDAVAALGSERVTIASSCSLLHVPYEAARETRIDPEIRPWLAFGAEKLDELALLAGGRPDRPRLRPQRVVRRPPRRAAGAGRAPGAADDDDRLVPADAGHPRGAPRPPGRSATTWSSTSASGSRASRSPSSGGCSPMAAVAWSRRSRSVTSPARNR